MELNSLPTSGIYILAPDGGHAHGRSVNNMAMFMAAEKFFAQQLDGRYQNGGTPEVVSRFERDHDRSEDGGALEEIDLAAPGMTRTAVGRGYTIAFRNLDLQKTESEADAVEG
jgi:hypothetical protein